MTIDLSLLKRELRRRRMPMRAFFRLAKLSRVERACILNGVCVPSYAVARVCFVLGCNQSALLTVAPLEEKAKALLVGE